MDLSPYVDQLRRELVASAELGGDEARALAERLTGPLEASLRLALLSALSAAAEEITSQLAPGSVDVRLRGGDLGFVVTPAPAPDAPRRARARTRRRPPAAPRPRRAATARITLRLPEQLKSRIEDAAAPRGVLGQHLAGPRGVPRPRAGASSGSDRPAPQPLVRPAVLRLGPVAARCPPSRPPEVRSMPTFDTPSPIQIRIDVSGGSRPGPRRRPRRHRGHGAPRQRAQGRRRPGRRPDTRRVRRRPAGHHLAAPRPAAVHGHHAVGRHRAAGPGGLGARGRAHRRRRRLRGPARRRADRRPLRRHPDRPGGHPARPHVGR